MLTAVTTYAANPVYVDVTSYGWYTSGAHPSNSGTCSSQPFTWSHSLAYSFAYPDYFPSHLYWDYLDFYGGYVSASGSFFFSTVWLWAFDGSDTREIDDMSDHSFFTYDITVQLDDWVSWSGGSVVWEAPVNQWGAGGPNYDCGFTSFVQWY